MIAWFRRQTPVTVILPLLALFGFGLYARIITGDCTGMVIAGKMLISAKQCFYMKTPLVWLSPDRTIPSPSPTLIPPVGVPEDVDPRAIKGIAAESRILSKETVADYPGGFIGIAGTWAEQSQADGALYVTASGEPFVGAFEMGVFNFPQPLQLIVSCLLDFVQVPCEPGAQVAQKVLLESDHLLSVPIRLANMSDGLHDLVVVVWQDLAGASAEDPARIISYQKAVRVTIAAGGSTQTQPLDDQPLPIPFHVFGLDGLAVTMVKDPWDSYGGLPPFAYIRARPGQALELYLHLFNQQSFRVDYAISAFMDYEQVALIYNGHAHSPLYFSTKADAWYPIRVVVRAPSSPGLHEFVILGEHFPQARMDLEPTLYRETRTLSLDVWSSARILLEVVRDDE